MNNNSSFARRLVSAIANGFAAVVEVVWGFFGFLGAAATCYGWSQQGSLGKGIEFFIQEFARFFSENLANPVLRTFGLIFDKYVEVFSQYPWAHVAVLAIGVLFLIRGKNSKRFVRSLKELNAETTSSVNTNLIGRRMQGASGQVSMARARKIGFQTEVTDTTGMPAVLARHAKWGLKK